MALLGVVFHQPGRLEIGKTLSIASDQPALVLITNSQGRQHVLVGDPLCTAKRIRIEVAGKTHTATLGDGDTLGRSVEALEDR